MCRAGQLVPLGTFAFAVRSSSVRVGVSFGFLPYDKKPGMRVDSVRGMMAETSTRAGIVRAYWDSANARDWERFGALLADDVVYELPQTRERVTGRDNYVRFNAEYPGDWRISLIRVIAESGQAVSWIDFLVGDESMPAVTFFDFDDSALITRITDIWPQPYEPPAGREHLVARY